MLKISSWIILAYKIRAMEGCKLVFRAHPSKVENTKCDLPC